MGTGHLHAPTIAQRGRRFHDLAGYGPSHAPAGRCRPSTSTQELAMSLVAMSSFLRRALLADALVSAAAGVVMSLGAGALAPLLNLPQGLLLGAGVVLFPWAAALIWMTRKAAVPAAAVWTVIVLNALWVAESVWVALGGIVQPNLLGQVFIAAQAIAVVV